MFHKEQSQHQLLIKAFKAKKRKHKKYYKLWKWFLDLKRYQKILVSSLIIIILFLSGLYATYRIQTTIAKNNINQIYSKPVHKKGNNIPNGHTDINSINNVTPQQLLSLRKIAIHKGYQKNYIGTLSVPSIKLNRFPVYQGMNKYTLALGAATYSPKHKIYEYGNFIIGAHNFYPQKVMFSQLRRIVKNDHVFFNDGVANYTFKVNSIRNHVSPYQKTENNKPVAGSIFFNDTEKRYLTLFTCDDNGATRTVVTANFVKMTF